jgi:outer membrane immunogenic protein
MSRKTLALGVLASLIWIPSVHAADIDYTPPEAVMYDWSGFYIGAHAGWGWGDTDWEQTEDIPPTPADDFGIGDSQDWDIDGFIAGGHLGWLFQTGNLVFGAEGSLSGTGIDGSDISVHGTLDDDMTTEIDLLVMATARLGFAMDNVLFYVKGGYAGADVSADWDDNIGPNQGSWSADEWHHGWTAGGGIEYGWNNWVFGVEFNHIDLGTEDHRGAEKPAGGKLEYDIDATINAVLARISFAF